MGVAGTIGMAGLVGVLGAAWSASAVAQAAGAEGANFIYQVRPGDTLIGVADRFMVNPAGWRELQALNKVADPYRLPPVASKR